MFETWQPSEIMLLVCILIGFGGPILLAWVSGCLGFAYTLLDRWLDRSRNSIKDSVKDD